MITLSDCTLSVPIVPISPVQQDASMMSVPNVRYFVRTGRTERTESQVNLPNRRLQPTAAKRGG